MIIDKLVVSPLGMNCYIVSCEKTKDAIVIDAGDEPKVILDFIQKKDYNLKYLINTHAHVDHVSAVYEIKKQTEVPFILHKKEIPILDTLILSQDLYGFGDHQKPEIDSFIDPDKIYEVGEVKIKVIETPGHTPGGVCFLVDNVIFVGDSLFYGSIGRTDLPGGSTSELMSSLRTKLMVLDESLVVYSGHGPETTIGFEKSNNPYINDESYC